MMLKRISIISYCEDNFIDIITWTIVSVLLLIVNEVNQNKIRLYSKENEKVLKFIINSCCY